MSKFQTDYDNQTDSLEKLVSSYFATTSIWSAIHGGFVKVSSSDGGFVWAYNSSNGVYVCQLPCNGKWTNIPQLPISRIYDIATDSNNVYILGDTKLWVAPVNNTGSWINIKLPIPATELFSTQTYIWVQDHNSDNYKQKCAKPCILPNWIESNDDTQITGSSEMHLYGKNKSGQAVVTDENIRTGWSVLPTTDTIIGSVDNKLYGLDSKLNITIYENGKSFPMSNNGITPERVIVNSNNIWMISKNPSDKGNLYLKQNSPSYVGLMKTVNPIDEVRTNIVKDIKDDYQKQSALSEFQDSLKKLIGYIKSLLKMPKKEDGDEDEIKRDTKLQQKRLQSIHDVQPIVIVMIGTLFTVVIVAAILDAIGFFNLKIFSISFFVIVACGAILFNYRSYL